MTSAAEPAPARRVGKYEVTSLLGQGAMGEVYLGADPYIGRPIALKLMKATGSEDGQRFLHEAQIVGGLSHPNIVVLHDFGFDDGGRPFLVMEHVAGSNLEAWLKQDRSLSDHLGIMEGLVRALAYAHSHGVLHRDLKPSNVRVTPDGQAKLMDFGIARGSAARLTATGAIMGTPAYMAPEIVEDARYSPQADIYSLGVLFYEMLGGGNPFMGQTVATTLNNVLTVEPPDLRELRPAVPVELSEAVMACLEKDPHSRPRDLSPLLGAIHKLRTAEPPSTILLPANSWPTLSILGAPSTRKRRRRKIARTTIAAAAGLLGLFAWLGTYRFVSRPAIQGAEGGAEAPPPVVRPTIVPAPASALSEAPAARTERPLEPRKREAPKPSLPSTAALRSAPSIPPSESPGPAAPPPSVGPEAAPAVPASQAIPVPALHEQPGAPAEEPAPMLSSLTPRTARRGVTARLELRGTGLRADHRAHVLRGRQDATAIRVTQQAVPGPTLAQLTILVDEDAPLGLYALVLVDGDGRATNSLTFEVVL